jgi:DNA invertase Pin-like site-specific DNA recombinase
VSDVRVGPPLARQLAGHAGDFRCGRATCRGGLVAQHSDRFARGGGDAPEAAQHLVEVMFWANRAAVRLRSVEDAMTFTNPILVAVMGERNKEDSRRKAEAVRKGMSRRRAKRSTPRSTTTTRSEMS